jgi:outer membrane murein-binding lipoprotein Lpp
MTDTDRPANDRLELPADVAALEAAIADLDPEEQALVAAIQAAQG